MSELILPKEIMMPEENPYALYKAKVLKVYSLTETEKLFLFRFEDPNLAENWTFRPGQFVQLTIPGIGEVPISICSSAMRKGFFELCIRKAGRVTTVVHRLKPGDTVLVRGPYGNGFPVDAWEGMDLLLIAAGLGTAPLRSVFLYAMDNRWKYGNITFINTARYGKDLLFYKELEAMKDLAEAENVKIIQSVTRDPEWPGRKGRPQNFIVEANTNPKNTAVAICGPPRMYKEVFESLINYGYRPENIFVTLERKMKCGIGKCGHCNVGTSTSWKYICKDGPVFTYFDIVSTPGLLD